MDMCVNFKLKDSIGRFHHCFSLNVKCCLSGLTDEFYYVIEALCYGSSGLEIRAFDMRFVNEYNEDHYTFSSPESAYEMVKKLCDMYPRYDDDRDYNIKFAPRYTIQKRI